jgi:tetratricopeptide (TPR) repeat protein
MLMGTPAYMAPEQVSGQVELQGPGCDIYTLGVILFELLTGQLPFKGNLQALLTQVLTAPPPPPSSLRPGLDPALDAVCARALAKQPQQRYASMTDFAQALEAYLRRQPKQQSAPPPPPPAAVPKKARAMLQAPTVPAAPAATPTPARRGAKRGWLLLLGAGAVALAVVVAGVLLLVRPRAATLNREGVALLDKQERDEAIKKFSRAVEIDPKFADAYTNRARAYYEKHDYDRAHDDATRAIDLDRKAARAYVYRAAAYDKLDQYEKSLSDCEEALRLDPNLALAYVYRASAIQSLRHDKEAALADCNKALELDPNLALAYLARSACHKEGAFREALADCNRAIDKEPRLASAYAVRGALKANMKQPDALKDFDRAHELDPHDPGTFIGRAVYFFHKGDLDTALGDADQAIALGPKLAGGYTLRAMIRCNQQKDLDKALDDAVKATQLNPSSSDAHVAKAMAYLLGKQDADQAFDACTVALRLNPKSGLAYLYRGLARRSKAPKDADNLEKALKDFDEGLKLLAGEATGGLKPVRQLIAEDLKRARAGQKGPAGRREGP